MKNKILKLTPEAFIRALQGKASATSNLPSDTELLEIKFDLFSKEVVAVIRSDSFEDIKEGYVFPVFKIGVSTVVSQKTQPTLNAKLDIKSEVNVPQKVEAKPHQTDTGGLEEEFTPEQRKLLRFSVDGDYVIVKPAQFLKTEWEDINDVVRSIGGRWVKGNIIDYWAIPKHQN